MTANFATFYLIIVLITGPFFQYLPMPEVLKWDEILLAKILNQAPVFFLLGYLVVQIKNVTKLPTFLLLIAFLLTCMASEVYYYVIAANNLFLAIVLNNIVSYIVLSLAFYQTIDSFEDIPPKIFYYAIAGTLIVLSGFSFSIYEIYQYYFAEKTIIFFILIAFIITAIAVVFLSFLVSKPFKKTWYKIIAGVLCMIIVDIYTYSCMFVFNSQPKLLFTFGKVLFSVGILLIVDGMSRKKFKDKKIQYTT